ncbi:MAG: Gfo/Idh/MocA family oxidoreductase [Acidobacteriaceae bacterium]|nr:Gfo/Idh/MocA family oxidoreductase [Acidobacteriaceae bacterium]
MNWLLVGVGDIAVKRVIPAIEAEPRSDLYGAVSRNQEKGRRYAARVWTDLAAALEDESIDAVYIATPVFLHAPQTIAALKAGKHVLCEKPMAMNYTEAARMNEAAQRTGKILGIAYFRRMYPKVRRAREIIESGGIGRPVLAEVKCAEWREENDDRPWLFDPKQAGGGPLFDIGSHRIDALNYVFGQPKKVSAMLYPAPEGSSVERNATVLIEYANGARGIVDARWDSHIERDEFRITGTEGELDLTPLSGPELRFGSVVEHAPCHSNRHYPCVENFVAAVLDGAPLAASGASSMWTDWVTERAVETAVANR